MATSPLVKKLQIKPGQRLAILNPAEGFLDELGPLPEGVELTLRAAGTFDLVLVFAKNTAELNQLARAQPSSPMAQAATRPLSSGECVAAWHTSTRCPLWTFAACKITIGL